MHSRGSNERIVSAIVDPVLCGRHLTIQLRTAERTNQRNRRGAVPAPNPSNTRTILDRERGSSNRRFPVLLPTIPPANDSFLHPIAHSAQSCYTISKGYDLPNSSSKETCDAHAKNPASPILLHQSPPHSSSCLRVRSCFRMSAPPAGGSRCIRPLLRAR